MTRQEELYLRQKALLDTFLEKGAITQAQYNKSFGDLTEKMGMDHLAGNTEKAYFAGGCFWCITPAFRNTAGVISVTSGYAGGTEPDPSYEDVKAQRTGHRETVCVTYDPERVGFDELIDIYLHDVDPFDGEGQFIDRGFSYTLAVFYTSETQREKTERAIAALEARFGEKARISVLPFTAFYEAEEYHQNWDLKHPEAFEEELISSGRKDRKKGE